MLGDVADAEEKCPQLLHLQPDGGAVADTVTMLEMVLADARSGKVRSVAFATVNRERCISTGYNVEEREGLVPSALVGALERLKLRILSADVVG